jgi:pSer/pThr/pTyr-binding forkhead associated (FHA) protein
MVAEMKAELVPENGDPPIPIVRDVTIVGRREYCDVVIPHHSLSKRHCILVKTDGLLVIRDLATTNGTKVKGQKVRWAALLPDDRVSLGGYKLRIYLGSDEMPSPSEQGRGRGRTAGVVGRGPINGGGYAGSPAPWAVPPASSIPRAATAGFPEPSMNEVVARPDSDHTLAVAPGQADKGMPAVPEFQFELLDDDDDIIDLD